MSTPAQLELNPWVDVRPLREPSRKAEVPKDKLGRSMSFFSGDTIHLGGFARASTNAIRRAITKNWPMGIRRERLVPDRIKRDVPLHNFKLYGFPFNPRFNPPSNGFLSGRLLLGIFESLFDLGWILSVGTGLDTLLFRGQEPSPAPRDWAAFNFQGGNKLQLIDVPKALREDIIANVQNEPHFLQKHGHCSGDGDYELTMKGSPWKFSGKGADQGRRFLGELLNCLDDQGWSLYASVDFKKHGVGGLGVWCFCRSKAWTPGLPAYRA